MSLEKKTTPYELLVRFDENGKLQGAHAGYLITVLDDGKVLNRSTELKQLDLAEQEGFPFDEFMEIVTLEALNSVDRLKQESKLQLAANSELAALKDALVIENEKLIKKGIADDSKFVAAQSEISNLTKQMDDLIAAHSLEVDRLTSELEILQSNQNQPKSGEQQPVEAKEEPAKQ